MSYYLKYSDLIIRLLKLLNRTFDPYWWDHYMRLSKLVEKDGRE
jgi:hypothetical protein